MEFWGAEVKAGMPLKVRPQVDHLIHLSQATIEGAKKGESALLYVTIDWTKYVIGTLSEGRIPQITFDLVFEQEFELSHSLSEGSVHFIGYKSPNIDQEEYYSDSEDDDEEVAVPARAAPNAVKAAVSKPKAKPAQVKPVSDEDDDDDDDDESDEDDSEDDGPGSDKVMGVEVGVEEEEDDEEDDSEDEEEEETPKQPEPSNKKRATASASKTPVPAKKTKIAVAATPQKTLNTGEKKKKKGGHTDTPHPAKKGNQSPGQSSGGNKKQFNSGKQSGSNNKGKGKGKGRA